MCFFIKKINEKSPICSFMNIVWTKKKLQFITNLIHSYFCFCYQIEHCQSLKNTINYQIKHLFFFLKYTNKSNVNSSMTDVNGNHQFTPYFVWNFWIDSFQLKLYIAYSILLYSFGWFLSNWIIYQNFGCGCVIVVRLLCRIRIRWSIWLLLKRCAIFVCP